MRVELTLFVDYAEESTLFEQVSNALGESVMEMVSNGGLTKGTDTRVLSFHWDVRLLGGEDNTLLFKGWKTTGGELPADIQPDTPWPRPRDDAHPRTAILYLEENGESILKVPKMEGNEVVPQHILDLAAICAVMTDNTERAQNIRDSIRSYIADGIAENREEEEEEDGPDRTQE